MTRVYFPNEPDPRLSFLLNNLFHRAAAPGEADFIVYPTVLWNAGDTHEQLRAISRSFRPSGKRVLVFVVHDYSRRYSFYANLIVFRTSLKASLMRANECVLPYVWECQSAPFAPLTDTPKPVVGFCGLVSKYRRKIVDEFERHPDIRGNIIRRDSFWGGKPHDPDVIREFGRNLSDSEFMICNRGNGNFSMRFYQTLAAGRIPVLVNTNMVLPFREEINWREFIVFEKNERDCVRKVLAIHAAGQSETMQRKCGELFQTWFSPAGYFLKQQRALPAYAPGGGLFSRLFSRR